VGVGRRHYAVCVPYSPKYLNEGERIILDLHPHWWDFVRPASYSVVGFVLALMSGEIAQASDEGWKVGLEWLAVRASWALAALGALGLVIEAVKWSRTHFVLTNHRVIYREGVVARTGVEIPIRRVNNVNFHQSFLERLVGAGDLLIESGGEDGQSRFANIRNPEEVQNTIQRAVVDFDRRED
jgi:uncharacterized membrane protein YdbT with pleckstrin-like domain